MSDAMLPMIDEHAPRNRSDKSADNYVPTDAEEKIVKFVMDKFRRAKKHRDKYDAKWLDNYKMFRGKQWANARPSWRHSDIVNMIFQAIQSMSPLESDSRPKFTFLPEEPSDTEVAEILNQVCESDWERNNWLLTLIEVVLDKYLYGTGLSSMEFNQEALDGAGAIEFQSTDPFHVFPDPDARDCNVDCEYFLTAVPWALEKAKKKWPDKASLIKCDTFDVYGGDKSDFGTSKIKSNIDRRLIYEESGSSDNSMQDYALIITMYCKSDEYEEIEELQTAEDGSQTARYVQKLKYPQGRKIVLSGNIILEDGPIPYDDGKIPFARCQNYILPREFWGISEIEALEGPQKIFNKLVCLTLDILTMTGNPILMVDSTAGLDTDNLFNRPGDVWEKEPGSNIQWLQGAQLNPAFLQMIDRMENWFNNISGSSDVSRGAAPASITAASAIEALQEASQIRTRQKLRLIDCYLKDCGQQYKSRVFQFYTVPRLFRLTNKQGLNKYFKFHVTTDEKTGKKMARVTNYIETPDGGFSEGMTKEYEIRGEMDVRAYTGSELPFAKAQKEQRLIKMFELGVIDAQELLTAMEYPNAEMVLQRMKASQMEAARARQPAAAPQQA